MNSLKKAKVVLLATNQKSKIHLSHNKLIDSVEETGVSELYKSTPHHLYIIDDSEIKHGDYIFDKEDNCILRTIDKQNADSINDVKEIYDVERYYKVIATTDILPDYKAGIKVEIFLPQPSPQFIDKYIECFNKSEIITDILVEYEIGDDDRGIIDIAFNEFSKLKIDKNNFITIKPIKNSWSREEVINLLKWCGKNTYHNSQNLRPHWDNNRLGDEEDILNKWISNNL